MPVSVLWQRCNRVIMVDMFYWRRQACFQSLIIAYLIIHEACIEHENKPINSSVVIGDITKQKC